MSRDWQKDMELCKQIDGNSPWSRELLMAEQPEITIHWLQQYAAEKERADKAEGLWKAFEAAATVAGQALKESEAREQKLREATEDLLSIFNHEGSWRSIEVSDGFVYALWDSDSEKIKSVENMLDSLYPKEETE